MALFFIQVYQISNTDYEGKDVYLAGSSLYLLLQLEASIKGFANSIRPAEYEKKFEELVGEAVNNYKLFLNNGCADRLKCEIW